MDKLYYISQGTTPNDHLTNIKKVCQAGCKLIQLRLKNVSLNIYKITSNEAKVICDSYDAKLIINDNIEVAKFANTTGVHLGKNDSSIKEARVFLGKDMIIGGTANTLEDCEALIKSGVDYIGLGPFQFTKTKDNLSPILGIEGFKRITDELRMTSKMIPIYAIGGIQTENVQSLLEVNITSIAVSGILTNQDNLKKEVEKLKAILQQKN
jgi:thiamine-phosphate pyrophosphorylase